MTVWIDHEGRPFFAGTYFPKEPRQGMASFREIMQAVSTAWATSRDDVFDQASRLTEAISGRRFRAARVAGVRSIDQGECRRAIVVRRVGFGQRVLRIRFGSGILVDECSVHIDPDDGSAANDRSSVQRPACNGRTRRRE